MTPYFGKNHKHIVPDHYILCEIILAYHEFGNSNVQFSEINQNLQKILNAIDLETLRLEQTGCTVRYCLRTLDCWIKDNQIPDVDYFYIIKDKLRILSNLEIERLISDANGLRPYPNSIRFDDIFDLLLAIHINADFLVSRKKDSILKFVNSHHKKPHFRDFSLQIHDINSLSEWLTEQDFVNTVTETVKVYTPKREIIILPKNSTPIDFAYKIHTEIGHKCGKAIVNGQEVSLNYELQDWDKIDIIPCKTLGYPQLLWKNFVKTPKAKAKILQYHRQQNIHKGESLLRKEFGNRYILTGEVYESIAYQLKCSNVQQLLEKLGAGVITIDEVKYVYQRYIDNLEAKMGIEEIWIEENQSEILGLEINCEIFEISKCCSPFPQDVSDIIGILNQKKGQNYITIHAKNCSNLINISSDKQLIIGWNCLSCTVSLTIRMRDRENILYHLLSILMKEEVRYDVRSIKIVPSEDPQQPKVAMCDINLLISSKAELEQIRGTLKRTSDILQVNIQEITPRKK